MNLSYERVALMAVFIELKTVPRRNGNQLRNAERGVRNELILTKLIANE